MGYSSIEVYFRFCLVSRLSRALRPEPKPTSRIDELGLMNLIYTCLASAIAPLSEWYS